MKVFFLITGLGMGGAEQQVVSLVDQLAKLGHQIVLCYLTGEAKVLPLQKEVKIIALNTKKNPLALGVALLRLIKIIKQFKPDVIHSHMVHANIVARLAHLFSRREAVLVCTAHNKNEGGKLRMLAYRLTDSLADISTNVSAEAVDEFIAKKAAKQNRMIVMYNGIDTDKFQFNLIKRHELRQQSQISDETKVLLAIGRLTEAKDYPNLLQAYATLKETNTVLWIVGTGEESYKAYLQTLIEQLAITDKVFFLGVRNDIAALLSAADLFILSSAWEGFGLVVAEAMACERLVVATDCGGVREVLSDCGWLVPPKQNKLLTLAIEEALNISTEQALKLTKKAQQRVLIHYNIENVTQQWLTLYKKLLDNKRR